MEENFVDLRCGSRGEAIYPKLPLLDPVSGKRQDGRAPSDVRPIFVQTNIRSENRGSAYLEVGNTKVICIVNGPKDLSKKIEFSASGLLSVEVQSVGGKTLEKDIILIKEALEAVVLLEKFPKCLLEICLTILEDSGSAVAACITAAGLALIDAGVPIYDTPVGGTLLYDGNTFFVDPTKLELQNFDLTDSTKNMAGGGVLTMGYLPTREQICLFTMEGKVDALALSKCMDALTKSNLKLFAFIRNHATEKLSQVESELSNTNTFN